MTDANSTNAQSGFSLLIAEAKRRHVFRAAGLYAGAAFVILQLADILMPSMGIEESAITTLLLIIAAGFPVTLIVAWIIDISGDGIKVTPSIDPADKSSLKPGRLVDLVIVVLALGVGYLYLERFAFEGASPSGGSTETQVSELLEPSIAVLPFENLSALQENEYFAAGIHEDILNELSQINELIVTSRTSTLAYKQTSKPVPTIAQELGVNYVMEGSIRRSANRVRISVQLIEAGSDKHIWSEGYERDLVDVFEIQQDVARQVAHALKVQFDIGQEQGVSPTKSLEAYELFLEARVLASTFEPDNVERAIALYRDALRLDSQYADSWAGLAIALQSTRFFGKADQQFEEAAIAADKALELAPGSWMANYAKAQILGNAGYAKYAEASNFYEKAISINDNDGDLLADYGFNLWFEGRGEDARNQFLAAYRRDPLSAVANMARAMAAIFEKEEENARKFVTRALEINPDSTYVNWWAGAAYMSLGDLESSSRRFSWVIEQVPNHLSTMLWISQILSTIGDADSSHYWLDKVEAIAPNNSFYMSRRADTFSADVKAEEFTRHVDTWLARDPENLNALRYKAYATLQRVRLAFDREDMQAFRELGIQSMNEGLSYLQETGENGEPLVRLINSWSFPSTAISAAISGEDELARKLFQMCIDFHEAQPEGTTNFKHLQLTVAHAGLGNTDRAIDHLNAMREQGFRAGWLIDAYGLSEDRYGIYHGINRNIAFMDAFRKLKEENEATLARIKEESPNLFPSTI